MSRYAIGDPDGERTVGSDRAATTERDGVVVRSVVDADAHEVPVVQYVVDSDRDRETTVRVLDSLPTGVAPEDVGFHEEYHGDRWRVRDAETVEFECELEPDGEIATLFGIRQDPDGFGGIESHPVLRVDVAPDEAGGSDDADGEPQIIALDDPTADAGGDDELTDRESASTDGGDGATSGAVAENVPAADRFGAFGETMVAAEVQSRDGAAVATDAPDGVVETLAAELRSGDLDDDDLEVLRRELGVELSESTAAFVEHVQTRLREKRERIESDVETIEDSVRELYGLKADAGEVERLADELERLDDETASNAAVEQLERLVAELADAKADLERLEATEDALDELRAAKADADRVDDLEAEVEALAESSAPGAAIDRLDDEVDRIDADVARLDRDKAEVDRVAALEDRVAEKAGAARVDGVQAHLATKADADRVNGLEADVATTDDRIDDLEADVADNCDRIDDLAESLAETADDRAVEDLSEALKAKAERAALERLADDLDALERRAVTEDGVEDRLDALRDAAADAAEVEASLEELREGKADVWTIDQVRSRIDDLEERTPDPTELQQLRERVDRAREETADRAAVESIERRLEEEYVSEGDISTTVRAH